MALVFTEERCCDEMSLHALDQGQGSVCQTSVDAPED